MTEDDKGDKMSSKELQIFEVPGTDLMAVDYEDYKKLQANSDALLSDLRAALEWIDAVPKNIVLPTMPGFDRDLVEEHIAKAEVRS